MVVPCVRARTGGGLSRQRYVHCGVTNRGGAAARDRVQRAQWRRCVRSDVAAVRWPLISSARPVLWNRWPDRSWRPARRLETDRGWRRVCHRYDGDDAEPKPRRGRVGPVVADDRRRACLVRFPGLGPSRPAISHRAASPSPSPVTFSHASTSPAVDHSAQASSQSSSSAGYRSTRIAAEHQPSVTESPLVQRSSHAHPWCDRAAMAGPYVTTGSASKASTPSGSRQATGCRKRTAELPKRLALQRV